VCDTLVYFKNRNHSYFAKNSDRDPEEQQIVYISHDPIVEFMNRPYENELKKYQIPLQKLKEVFFQFNHPYSAFISRPTWIWGAEMGVNEYGLAIGNEAIFSKQKVPLEGLLGMDILRIALHNCITAAEAVTLITRLIEHYDQGGDCGFKRSFKYFNAFLLKDYKKAYIIETSAKNWAVKEINEKTSISNTYSIRNDYELTNLKNNTIDFKKEYENKIMSFRIKGAHRRNYIIEKLENQQINLLTLFQLLRSHNGLDKIKNGTKSVCMHPGVLIKSETTSSLIVDYINNQFVIWYTGAPNPCVSLYRPMMFDSKNNNYSYFEAIEAAINCNNNWRLFSRKMLVNYKWFKSKIKKERDKIEKDFISQVYDILNKKDYNKLMKLITELTITAEEFRKKYI